MTGRDLGLGDLVGDPALFADEHWGRRPLRHATDHDFGELLDVAAVEALLLTAARRPTFRLVQDGARLEPERSTSPIRMGGAALDDVADVAKISAAVDDGATLVLQGLQRTCPPLIDLCRRLERELSHPVQANAYLTPAGASGLARHRDDHDVLVLHVSGRKGWDVEGLGEVAMVPGAVLYLPAGTAHSAAAQDAPSLHITIGVLRVTYGQVVRRLLDRLDGLGLDDPLPLAFGRDPGALVGGLEARLAAVATALGRADAPAIADREAQRARAWRPPLPAGQLQSVLRLGELDADSVVRVRPDHPAWVAEEPAPDGRTVLHLRDREVHLPPSARAAVEHLLVGEATKVGELPGLSAASGVVVVARLVREGLLVLEG